MTTRSKRTYSLRPETVRRVRELAEQGYATSQDAIVDAAVDRLYRETRAEEETRAWADAASDAEFRTEIAQIAAAFDRADSWPE